VSSTENQTTRASAQLDRRWAEPADQREYAIGEGAVSKVGEADDESNDVSHVRERFCDPVYILVARILERRCR
jgi:hypothetical protein